jgi:hypothetical protein
MCCTEGGRQTTSGRAIVLISGVAYHVREINRNLKPPRPPKAVRLQRSGKEEEEEEEEGEEGADSEKQE